MRIVVLVKPTPNIEKVRFDMEKGLVDRSSVKLEINPFDLHAIEAAVKIKEALGGEVIVISMAPPNALNALRDAIARGADRAILVSDKVFAGADTLATATTLAAAIRKLGSFDLVICGEKSVDGDTGQVGPEVAELLDIPHASYVVRIVDVSHEVIKVVSDFGNAYYLIKLKLPALISVTKDVNVPRKPKFKDLMRARRAEITIWRFKDLAQYLSLDVVGLQGSPTRVVKAFYAEPRARRTVKIKGSEAIEKVIELLSSEGVL